MGPVGLPSITSVEEEEPDGEVGDDTVDELHAAGPSAVTTHAEAESVTFSLMDRSARSGRQVAGGGGIDCVLVIGVAEPAGRHMALADRYVRRLPLRADGHGVRAPGMEPAARGRRDEAGGRPDRESTRPNPRHT